MWLPTTPISVVTHFLCYTPHLETETIYLHQKKLNHFRITRLLLLTQIPFEQSRADNDTASL